LAAIRKRPGSFLIAPPDVAQPDVEPIVMYERQVRFFQLADYELGIVHPVPDWFRW
jgi:hypothetical protein